MIENEKKEIAMNSKKMLVLPWTRVFCVECGMDFLATRTKKKIISTDHIWLCPECDSYKKGHEDGQKSQAQYNLSQQLEELIELANKNGLYNAADWLKEKIFPTTNIIKVHLHFGEGITAEQTLNFIKFFNKKVNELGGTISLSKEAKGKDDK